MSEATENTQAPTPNGVVQITINNVSHLVRSGRITAAEIKNIARVPSEEVEQIVNGKLTPLPDDGAVTVVGGEIFITHPRDSASS